MTRRTGTRWFVVAVIVTIVLSARALWWEFLAPIQGDTAWGLSVADQMAGGRELYRDILDINPPLIFWLFGAARAVAAVMSVTPETVYRIFVLAVTLGVTWSAVALTRDRRWALALPLVLIVLVGRDFGQRGHLILALLVPLVLRPAVPSRSAELAIGIAAGLAICLKPFFAPVWLGLLIARRRLTLTDLAIATTGTAYLGAVLVWAPGYVEMVEVFGPVYRHFESVGVFELVTRPETLGAIAVAGLAYLAGERRLVWAAAAGLVAFLVQGKGWSYHVYPFASFALLGTVTTRRAFPAIAAVAFVALAWGVRIAHPEWRVADYEYAGRRALEPVGPGERALLLYSIAPDAALRIRERGAVSVASVQCLWWVKAGAGTEAERMAQALVGRDVIEGRADWIALESPKMSAKRVGPGFSVPRYLTADTAVGRLLAEDFTLVDTTGVLWLYRRTDRLGPSLGERPGLE